MRTRLASVATALLLATTLLVAPSAAAATTLTTLIDATNVTVRPADATKGTDFYYPSAAGVVVPATAKSWQLTVDKTGLPAGVKYLTIAVEYQRSTGWQLDVSNEPDGWVGGVNHLDFGATSFIDAMSSEIGSYTTVNGQPVLVGEFPSHARLHIKYSSGFVSPHIQLLLADDLSLI